MADIDFTNVPWQDGNAPAVNAENLKEVYDAVNEIAHKASRTGVLDADTVSAYGIGVAGNSLGTGYDLDTVLKTGFYTSESPTYATPSAATPPVGYYAICVEVYNGTQIVQTMTDPGTKRIWVRTCFGSPGTPASWMGWYEIFNASTDGNGGQPPVGKPKEYRNSVANLSTTTIFTTATGKIYRVTAICENNGAIVSEAIVSNVGGTVLKADILAYGASFLINISGTTVTLYQALGGAVTIIVQVALMDTSGTP